QLTEEENNYLQSKPVIVFHNERDWKPYDYFENGAPKGFCIDVVHLIARKVGFEAKFLSGRSWDEYLYLLQNKQIDVIHNAAITPERERYMLFTGSYLRFSDALFVHRETKGIKSLKDLQGKTLAVVQNYYQEDLLRLYYPQINLLPVKSTTGGISAVSTKKALAAINEVGVSNSFLNDFGIQDVVLGGLVQDDRFHRDLHIAVHRDNRILRNILQKGLEAISAEEMASLRKKWLILGPKNEFNVKLFAYITLGVLFVVGLLSYRTRLLRKHNRELQAAQIALQGEVQQKELLLRELNHRVKNNLQIIQSIVSLQAARTDTTRILEEIEGNIQAISLAYDKLTYQDSQDSIQLQDYLGTLMEHLVRVGDRSIQVDTDIPARQIDIRTAVNLGLIITECYNNSVKYAFDNRITEPRFSIRSSLHADQQLGMTIADNGRGFDPDYKAGVGLELIHSLCKSSFQTAPRFYNDQGAKIEISIPL
ncbi:MAG: transporter substrate-binding domain-containing protein, partial [Desulfuromonadaceae bacterium]|nr:transporter substrate-binding domain-containing protein [Desulfuromonadaceae bacterium]